jgi:hypothetical protein
MRREPSLDWNLTYRPADPTLPCCYADCEACATCSVVSDGAVWWVEYMPLTARTHTYNADTNRYEETTVPQAFEFCADHGAEVAERRNARVVPGMAEVAV